MTIEGYEMLKAAIEKEIDYREFVVRDLVAEEALVKNDASLIHNTNPYVYIEHRAVLDYISKVKDANKHTVGVLKDDLANVEAMLTNLKNIDEKRKKAAEESLTEVKTTKRGRKPKQQ